MTTAPPAAGTVQEHRRDGYLLSDDPARLDLPAIHAFLRETYWARGIPLETVRRSIAHSLCFGLYAEGSGAQAGFARVITDRATFAYLGDVFVLPEHRGRGLSKWLMACILAHPALQGLRHWALATADAHGLYAQYGFTPLAQPERWMRRHDPDVYTRGATGAP
jgi:GNAT superfamily N-acetyltransferase